MAQTDGDRRREREKGDPALVRNASDGAQVRRGARLEVRRRERELNDWRAVLATAEGRRVIWQLLEHCKVFTSIWDPSSRMHYQAGVQDVGHYVMAEIAEADDDALVLLMREARARARAEALENQAARTPRAASSTIEEDSDDRDQD